MSQVIQLHLPEEIEQPLTTYAKSIIMTPNKFVIDNNYFDEKDAPSYDLYDGSIPALGDEFILNHDLTSVDWKEKGDLHTNALSWIYKLSFPPADICFKLFEYLEDTTQKILTQHRGNFLYPKGGFMGWHTNSDFPGTRVYLAYSSATNGSYFKYVDRSGSQPEIITDWDIEGWSIRTFCPSSNPNEYLWHCVGSPNATRISFGFLLK